MRTSCQVDFEPIGRRVTCNAEETLLDAARRAGVMLNAVCGGEGVCGRCIVRVLEGEVSPSNLNEEHELGEEQIAAGLRLACQTRVFNNVRVYVPPDSLATAQRIQIEGQPLAIPINPVVRAFEVRVPPPTLEDLRADTVRLRDALGQPNLFFPLSVLRQYPEVLRVQNFQLTVFVRGNEVVGVRPLYTLPLGLAVDIGTTKVAAYLVNLSNGETLASAGSMNPQIAFGEDVMARLTYAINQPQGLEQLRQTVVEAVNALARELCSRIGRESADIVDAVVVGNTAMHHLFLGLPVSQLGLAPYVPAESAPLDLPAQEVGLELAPGANVHLLPIIAGFVGADHVAMLLATAMERGERVVLGLDIGTNTEVSLVTSEGHFACSTASGPAFEGAHIRFGMRAAPGAIEKVLLRDQRVLVQTVENQPPVGLCGSGILDLVAQMRLAGILTPRGAPNQGSNHPRLRRGDHGFEFVVVPGEENGGTEITFSREDVTEIQLAKGAIRAGINILLQKAGIAESDVEEVIIAGAFGTYLDVRSGIEIGMFPRLDPARFRQVGNAAGAGARMALLSLEQRQRAVRLAQQVTYVELTAEPTFPSVFANALSLE